MSVVEELRQSDPARTPSIRILLRHETLMRSSSRKHYLLVPNQFLVGDGFVSPPVASFKLRYNDERRGASATTAPFVGFCRSCLGASSRSKSTQVL